MMNRLILFLLLIQLSVCVRAGGIIAVTIDDLPVAYAEISAAYSQKMTLKMLRTLKQFNVQAVGFVNEAQFNSKPHGARYQLIKQWVRHGQELGNHTFSHPSFNETTLDAFVRDVEQGERVIRNLMMKSGKKLRYFRHPYLRTGADTAKRIAFESYLQKHAYTIAPVTLESSDYMFNCLYIAAIRAKDTAAMHRIGKAYVAYTLVMTQYFDRVSTQVFGRKIPHVFLCHANPLNADWFPTLFKTWIQAGYRFETLDYVMQDVAYQTPDLYFGKGGISWLHRWNTINRMELLKMEPEPPDWVVAAYKKQCNG